MTRPENNRFLDMRGGEILQFQTNLSRFGLTADEARYLNTSEALMKQCLRLVKAKVAAPWTDGHWKMSGPIALTTGAQKVGDFDDMQFWKQTAINATEKAKKLGAIPVTVEVIYYEIMLCRDATSRYTYFLTDNNKWVDVWRGDVEARLVGTNRIEFRERKSES